MRLGAPGCVETIGHAPYYSAGPWPPHVPVLAGSPGERVRGNWLNGSRAFFFGGIKLPRREIKPRNLHTLQARGACAPP